MKNRRKIFCAALALFLASSVSALEVARAELESTKGNGVVFQNYSGPHTIINSIEQIRSIGSGLAPSVAANLDNFTKAGNENRYQVIHAIDPNEKEKLDADIIVIGQNATVDHIRNLRRIISAYLESAYKYSRSDADTIAAFATVYNAVYRNDFDNFNSKYKKIVTDNLTQGKIGISTNYQEWPGQTQIVIPLFDVRGDLSTVDTSELSDKEVVKSLQNEEDKGIDDRKAMVDLKEREADNASDKAQEAQKKAAEENEKLKEEQNKTNQANQEANQAKKEANTAQKDADNAQKQADNAQKQADNAQKIADEAQKKAEANPDDEKAKADAEQKQAIADEKQAIADEKKEIADQKQENADEKKAVAQDKQDKANEQAEKTAEQAEVTKQAQDESSKAQAQADKKRAEAQDERAAIAEDQQSLIRTADVADANVLYGLKSIDELGAMSAIVKMDSTKGTLIKESPVSVIRCRTVYEDSGNFVAIAGTNFGNGAIKLVLIDKENLEIVRESSEVLSETSVLVEQDGSYYAIVKNGAANFVLGKFNNSTELLMKSPVSVKAATPITVTEKGILVTASDGRPILLSTTDLTAIGNVNAPTAPQTVIDEK